MMASAVQLSLPLVLAGLATAAPVDYTKQIAPLFDKHCSDCHSASDADGDFALDTFAALMKGGKTGKAVEAGKGSESLLVKFLEGRSGKTGKNQFMPPGKRDHLSAEEIAMVKQWIDEGARGSDEKVDPLAKLPKVASKAAAKPAYAIAASAKGDMIALASFGSVELIDVAARKTLRTITGIAGKPNAVLFDQSGDALFVAAGDAGVSGVAYQFKISDGTKVREFTGHTDALYALAISPDGKLLTTGGYDQKIKLWDLSTGKEVRTIKGHNGCINALAFRPDGKVLASASADRTVKLWNPATGDRFDTFSQPLKEQLTVAFSGDGRTLIAGGADSRLRIWRVSDSAKEGTSPLLDTKFACEGAVLKVVTSPNGKLVAVTASDRTAKLWDIASFATVKSFETQSDWAAAAAWVNDKQLALARQDGTASFYEIETGKPMPLKASAATKVAAKPKARAKAASMSEVTTVDPPGIKIGAEAMLTITGKGLADVSKVQSSNPQLSFSIVEKNDTKMKLKALAPKGTLRGEYDVTLAGEGGASKKVKLHIDSCEQITTTRDVLDLKRGEFDCWGTLNAVGQRDDYRFKIAKDTQVIFDLSAARLGSAAKTIQLELFDEAGQRLAVNHGLDSGSDPLIAWKAENDGVLTARVSETTLEGSASHTYRLTATTNAYVTGWWPLTVKVGTETRIELVGYNLHGAKIPVTADKPGMTPLPVKPDAYRTRVPLSVLATDANEAIEREPNDTAASAMQVSAPVSINGRIFDAKSDYDADVYAFSARQGEEWMIETYAAQAMSPTDTRIEVLNADGSPVERMRLQAVRSSFNNFRSVDADNPDIRLENYTETGLNEFVYFNGDIMRTFRQPRGPDGGFFFYTINNKRRAYFDTTATAHTLEEPCYIVEPLKASATPLPNGLPVLTLTYTNDDDGERKLGRDSRLHFTASKTATYLVRVTDSREWSGPRFAYRLNIRKPAPDFSVKLTGNDATIPAGGSLGFALRADRRDDFDDDVRVTIEGVPQGYFVSSPVIIQAGHTLASGVIHASPDAPMNADWSKVKVVATARINGQEVKHEVNGLGTIKAGPKAKFVALLEADREGKPAPREGMKPQLITVAPGQITKAWIRVERNGDDGIINFDVHSLPHGVIVNDIGLNGVQVRAGENEREIEFTAAKWVPEQERLVHACVSSARNEADSTGLASSFPVLMRVVKSPGLSAR